MAKKGGDISEWVFNILLAVFVVSALLGTIFNRLNAMESDTTNFSASEIALLGILGIIILIALVRKLAKGSGMGK